MGVKRAHIYEHVGFGVALKKARFGVLSCSIACLLAAGYPLNRLPSTIQTI